MSETTTFAATQIGVFNPGRLSDNEIERAFVTRIKLLEYLLKGIVSETPEAIPQHYLVIGQRGMGKSTLLHRIAVELRKEKHQKEFIPLTFPEEQYNIDRLSKFWLNCLDALADALDREGSTTELTQIDGDIRQWSANAKDIPAAEMYDYFAKWIKRVGRRPVLLVDNLGLIFDRLSRGDQHELRAILMDKGAPILLGASANTIDDTVDYSAPFYDAFQIQYLKKLSFDDTQDVLRNLADLTNNLAFISEMEANRARLRTLYQLTGGTPRTIVMLYPLIQNGFSLEVQNDLEGLMDVMTPLYKARFEELSEQMQVILDAVALHWDPIALDDLRQSTQLDNSQLSPQLKRLTEVGWIERLSAYQKKGNAYEISERFFNIWYLMRRSSRRQKKELLCLTKFLVSLYGEGLKKIGERALQTKTIHRDQVSMQLAIADGVNDPVLSYKLRSKSYQEIFELIKTDATIFKDFEIPESIICEEERKLILEAYILKENENWFGANQVYHKVLRINKTNKEAWLMIGLLNQKHLHNYVEAESAYKEAIRIDANDYIPWNNLGNLYEGILGRYAEAEIAFSKAIEINDKIALVWCNIGIVYSRLKKYVDAEKAYFKAIDLDGKFAPAWNNLGNLYENSAQKYDKAEVSYKKAIKLDKQLIAAHLNLMSLYRDRLSRINEAKNIFDRMRKFLLEDSCYLHTSLFAFNEGNVGIGEAHLLSALKTTEESIPFETQDVWWRFAAVVLRLKYGQDILEVLQKNGYDTQLRPYYVAIQSLLAKDSNAFLNSIAVEVREVAADIAERIKRYM